MPQAHVDRTSKAVRRARMEREKAALASQEAALSASQASAKAGAKKAGTKGGEGAEKKEEQEDDIAAQVGLGAASAVSRAGALSSRICPPGATVVCTLQASAGYALGAQTFPAHAQHHAWPALLILWKPRSPQNDGPLHRMLSWMR